MATSRLKRGALTTKKVKCACGHVETWPKDRTGAGLCSKCKEVIRG